MGNCELKKGVFIIAWPFESIGGHLLSGITLAKHYHRQGYEVGLLVAPLAFDLPELDELGKLGIPVHFAPYPEGRIRPHISSPPQILKIVQQHNYDHIIAMDWYSAFQSVLAVLRYQIPLVQVVAGGSGVSTAFCWAPGMVVFSQEIIEVFTERYHLQAEDITLASGRVDFEYFKNKTECSSLNFSEQPSFRLLLVSRLAELKAKAILHLFSEIVDAAKTHAIQLRIVGDGEARPFLEQEAAKIDAPNVDIRFLGNLRIQAGHYQQADLVIAQGRSVIEAVASGVPAAVCGNDGYMGLVSTKTLPLFATTNLSSRGQQQQTTLVDDLNNLAAYKSTELNATQQVMYDRYDVSNGIVGIRRAFRQRYEANWRTSRWAYIRAYVHAWLRLIQYWVSNRITRIKQRLSQQHCLW